RFESDHPSHGVMQSTLPLILLSCWLPAAQPAANEASDLRRIEQFAQSCENARRGEIMQLEHALGGLRSGAKSADSAPRIARIEADLRTLRAGKNPVVPNLRFPPEVGGIGRLPQLSAHVEQILSDQEMLVRCFFPVRIALVRNREPQGETVVQETTFVVRGLPTAAVQEGSDIELSQVFEVVGKSKYPTANGGSATALVVSEFDMKKVEPLLRKSS